MQVRDPLLHSCRVLCCSCCVFVCVTCFSSYYFTGSLQHKLSSLNSSYKTRLISFASAEIGGFKLLIDAQSESTPEHWVQVRDPLLHLCRVLCCYSCVSVCVTCFSSYYFTESLPHKPSSTTQLISFASVEMGGSKRKSESTPEHWVQVRHPLLHWESFTDG